MKKDNLASASRKYVSRKSNIFVIGNSGYAREVARWSLDAFGRGTHMIVQFLDPGSCARHKLGLRDRIVCGIPDIGGRIRAHEELRSLGRSFDTVVHPTAVVAASARLDEGVVLCPFTIVSDNVVINALSSLNFYASCGHDAVVGAFCVLSPYATVNADAQLEREVFLGTHSSVIQGRIIGTRSKISANSAALYNVPAFSLVCGVRGEFRTVFSPSNEEAGLFDED